MLGMLDDYDQMMTLDFKSEGDTIYLVGTSREDLGSSEYLRGVLGVEFSPCPYFDLEEEFSIQQVIRKAIGRKLIESAHDVSDGGVFANLVESAMPQGLGFEVITNPNIRKDAWLFGESQSRVIVSVSAEQKAAFERFLQIENVAFETLGLVKGTDISVDNENWGAVTEWKRTFETTLSQIMND
jgi:phosphoribosylformylglycinamidine synthase